MTSSTPFNAESLAPVANAVLAGAPVGLVGVGVMGRCMLDCLLAGKYVVVAYDPAPAAQEYVRGRPATLAADVPAVAEACRLVITSLPANAHVLEVVAAIAPRLTPGHILVDTSTVSPETSRKAAKLAGERGARYIDAPILGRPSAAGKWLLPSGGSREALELARPALETFARAAVWVGETGAGNTLKLLNQLMFSVINGISAEVLAVAAGLGVDLRTFYDTVANSGAATVSGLFKETGGRIVDGRFDNPVFTVGLLCKDAGLALEMARSAGLDPKIAGFVQELNLAARDGGLATEDTSALFKWFLSEPGCEIAHSPMPQT